MLRKLLRATCFCALAGVSAAHAQDAASLKARHAALRAELLHNQFQRPLHVESTESGGSLKGDVYALIEQPFSVVGPALQEQDHWCEILILHLNVKHCRPSGATLNVSIGRKFDQPVADAYLFAFAYKVAVATPDYLQVTFSAAQGPLGTSGYHMRLEVVAVDEVRSFVHFSYAYDSSRTARTAAQLYFATRGRDKVGFSIVGNKADGQPIYIGSTRGAVERNAMRSYLAIAAYLGALSSPAQDRFEKQLRDWYDASEHYAVQLHELERSEYLQMKRKEGRRQQVAAAK